jgi:hypothetical protein
MIKNLSYFVTGVKVKDCIWNSPKLAININEALHLLKIDKHVTGPPLSTPSTSKTTETPPKSFEEYRKFPKAQARVPIKKGAILMGRVF